MKKQENGVVTLVTFLLTYVLQKVLTVKGIINRDHLVTDFLSWAVIFLILYFILTKLFHVKQRA